MFSEKLRLIVVRERSSDFGKRFEYLIQGSSKGWRVIVSAEVKINLADNAFQSAAAFWGLFIPAFLKIRAAPRPRERGPC